MARIVPLRFSAALLAGAALVLAPLATTQDPGGPPALQPSMTMQRVGDALHVSSDVPHAPLWLIVGTERTSLPVAGVLVEVEPDWILPAGRLNAAGEAVLPLRGELPRYTEDSFWFQAVALTPDLRPVVSNARRTTLPVDPPRLRVYDHVERFRCDVELFRVACAPLQWTASISVTVPTTGYRLELVETEADGSLFQATVTLVEPMPGSIVAPAFETLALGVDCVGPQPVESVEVTLITTYRKP